VLAYAPQGSEFQDLGIVPMREGTVVRKVHSADRLMSEVTRILHVPEGSLPEYKRLKLEKLRQIDDELAGCRVLIVDDDVRNIFALTSILERHNIEVLHAENGRAGIDTLLQTPGIDLVLMDIMMPGMDGYETIRAVRELESLRNLPIIAVTAKAMKGDREKCIDSGASDYIAKPVDLDQLFSLMRVWVHDRRQKAAGARTAV
jgi:CheY-like chemotaxis protein